MIKNDEYLKILKSMISCVSYGDYYSIKELSNLELEKMKEIEKQTKKDLKKVNLKIKKLKNIPLEEWDNKNLCLLIKSYSDYILNKIEYTNDINDLQRESISIEEFIGRI